MRTLIFLAVLIIATLTSCSDEVFFDTKELGNVHIGLYVDKGATNIDKVEDMLKQLNCCYTPINKDSILQDFLDHFDVILFPGGDMWEYKNHLSDYGMQNIIHYIQHGGGYIGICGGSYFAAEKIIWRGWANEPRQYLTNNGLGLFHGTADGPLEDFAPSYQKYNCKVNIENCHPITINIQKKLEYLYSYGPKFVISDSSNITVLGYSNTGNHSMILAIEHQNGKVFLTALHPEFDSDKSSWEMISNAILWCSGKL